MVDTNTLIALSTIAQTVVITVTLIVFILQFRSQERSIKESSYQGLLGRYNDLVATLVDKPDLAYSLLMATAPEELAGASREDAALYGHMLLAYGIVEEAYLLYAKKWIDEDNWLQWSAFLERLSRNPLFKQIHEMSAGTFDKDFQEYVSKKILKE